MTWHNIFPSNLYSYTWTHCTNFYNGSVERMLIQTNRKPGFLRGSNATQQTCLVDPKRKGFKCKELANTHKITTKVFLGCLNWRTPLGYSCFSSRCVKNIKALPTQCQIQAFPILDPIKFYEMVVHGLNKSLSGNASNENICSGETDKQRYSREQVDSLTPKKQDLLKMD